jgi:peptide-methionine (S)-S-oxide reductase
MPEQSFVLGGGCFWCIEAVFQDLVGVSDVVSGYAGGTLPNPTYDQVCSGRSGHAEVVKVTFDPETITAHDILTIFFTLHDPTTLNRQGADSGTQYRSIILYQSAEQREVAQAALEEFADIWDDPIVTELQPLETFYPAEDYHQHYFTKHPEAGYCQLIIEPKVAKLRQRFQSKLRA